MSKVKKSFVVGILGLSLCGAVLPPVLNTVVYADEQVNEIKKEVSDYIDNYKFSYISRLGIKEQEIYKNSLKRVLSQRKYTDVNRDKVIEEIDKFVANENNFVVIEYRASFLDGQGITVNEMGAILDTAISVAFGGTTAYLANSVKRMGKHAVKSKLRSIISRFFGNWFVNDVFFEFLFNVLSPGQAIAEHWDKHDRIPGNGRINF